ncbi:DUF1176 domain-containing protein [Terrarubrum flagellatum]|uniref:DUF1176 domain-containing protein n=1 Tax=Terrirubrum flagellatum TaxID=2895980 RepID=UPI0031452F02
MSRFMLAMTLLVLSSAARAETSFAMAKAPAGLKALIEANSDKPGNDDGCSLPEELKPDDVVAVLHPLSGGKSLLLMECTRTMKFNMQRAFIVTGDDFAGAARARLPVRKEVDPAGVTSDSMSLEFDAKRLRLSSEAWEGASCWSKRVWAWKGGAFVKVSDRKTGVCR